MIPKFRAWDSYENEMRYDIGVIEFNADDKNVSALAFNYHLDDTGYGEIDNSRSEYYDGLCFELMQSTGLLDINDKEIYIGDLVKCDISDNIIRDCAYEVSDTDFELVLKSKFGNWPLVRYIDYVEVIGNIYQHPHLLEADSHER